VINVKAFSFVKLKTLFCLLTLQRIKEASTGNSLVLLDEVSNSSLRARQID